MKEMPLDKVDAVLFIEGIAKAEEIPELDWGTLALLLFNILTTEPLSHKSQATLTGIAGSALKNAGKDHLNELLYFKTFEKTCQHFNSL